MRPLACAVLACTLYSPLHAQSCSYSITNINFGTIDVTANTAYTTTGTFTANCTTPLLGGTMRVCPNINAGTGGSSSGNPRYLLSGGNQLAFNLYQDTGHTTIWGSFVWGFPDTAPTIDITIPLLGSASASRTIFARIPNAQQTLPAGTYVSSFAGANTVIASSFAIIGSPPSCAAIGSTNGVSAPFMVTATNIASCLVSATTLDFGTAGVLTSNVDSTNTLSVTCTAATPYTISLNGGSSGATDPTQRKMSKGAETITYGIYRDAARSQPWGATVGTNTAAGTGTGLSQSYTAYGRVLTQPTPSPGTYTDTIVVTITY